MQFRKFFRLFAAFCLPLSLWAGPKPVMVHYMPWFVAKPFSPSWGWHWTMNHYNPDIFYTNGQRQIASWYYPLIGPYDTLNPAVLEYHVALMKLGGIDGVIVDWYGADNYNDYGINNERTAALFNYIRKAGLKFSLCYEDSTIQAEINGNYITAAEAVSHAQQTMLYAQSNYFNDPVFLRWNNQPVLLNFGPQYFKNSSQWQSIFSALSASNQPAFFTEDNRLAVGAGAFDWPPMSLSQTNAGVLSTAQLEGYLSNFEKTGKAWPAYISGGFPRFHDIYQQAGVEPSFGYLDDRNGQTLQETLSRALTNSSAVAQVITWNDYGEGTVVEPTVDFGYQDLGIIQNFRRQYLDPAFSYTTNDLTLALRLYNQREKYQTNNVLNAELDRVFNNIINSNLDTAALQLTGMESNVPVIYNVSATEGQLQFSIGGYVSSNGLKVQMSSNLFSGWQTVATLSPGTNQPVFITTNAPQGYATFFKAQNN